MSSPVLKVNIGSGLSGAAGWYNIDNSPTVLFSRLPFGRALFKTPGWPKDVRRHDDIKGLPFPDNSVQYIYSSHTFEHFTWEGSLTVARECFRVLREDGILRVVVPDLKIALGKYRRIATPWHRIDFSNVCRLGHTFHDLVHPGANHSQMFDERSLLHLFREAGFARPEVKGFLESRIPQIDAIKLEQRKHESLYVEGVR